MSPNRSDDYHKTAKDREADFLPQLPPGLSPAEQVRRLGLVVGDTKGEAMFLLLVTDDWSAGDECVEGEFKTSENAQVAAKKIGESCSWRIFEGRVVASFTLPDDEEDDEDDEEDN